MVAGELITASVWNQDVVDHLRGYRHADFPGIEAPTLEALSERILAMSTGDDEPHYASTGGFQRERIAPDPVAALMAATGCTRDEAEAQIAALRAGAGQTRADDRVIPPARLIRLGEDEDA